MKTVRKQGKRVCKRDTTGEHEQVCMLSLISFEENGMLIPQNIG